MRRYAGGYAPDSNVRELPFYRDGFVAQVPRALSVASMRDDAVAALFAAFVRDVLAPGARVVEGPAPSHQGVEPVLHHVRSQSALLGLAAYLGATSPL